MYTGSLLTELIGPYRVPAWKVGPTHAKKSFDLLYSINIIIFVNSIDSFGG